MGALRLKLLLVLDMAQRVLSEQDDELPALLSRAVGAAEKKTTSEATAQNSNP